MALFRSIWARSCCLDWGKSTSHNVKSHPSLEYRFPIAVLFFSHFSCWLHFMVSCVQCVQSFSCSCFAWHVIGVTPPRTFFLWWVSSLSQSGVIIMVDLHSMMKVWSPFSMALALNTGQTLLIKQKQKQIYIYIYIYIYIRGKPPIGYFYLYFWSLEHHFGRFWHPSAEHWTCFGDFVARVAAHRGTQGKMRPIRGRPGRPSGPQLWSFFLFFCDSWNV